MARERLRGTPWTVTGDVPGPVLRRRWPIEPSVMRPVGAAIDQGKLSNRGIDRILRVAWTLSDLAGVERPGPDQVQEALDLRRGTRTSRPVAVPA